MTNFIDKRSRVRTKGAAEMLAKRRLGVISNTIAEYGLAVSVRFVSTIENMADRMTRVPKKWLEYRENSSGAVEVSAAIATGIVLRMPFGRRICHTIWASIKPSIWFGKYVETCHVNSNPTPVIFNGQVSLSLVKQGQSAGMLHSLPALALPAHATRHHVSADPNRKFYRCPNGVANAPPKWHPQDYVQ